MTYVGQQPATTFDSGIQERFTSLTTNTVTLSHEISAEEDILVVWNNIVQDKNTYSVGGTGNKTVTLGGTLVSADVVTVYYLNKVMQSVNPTAGSVGLTQLSATGTASSSNFLRGDNSWQTPSGFDVTSITGATALDDVPATTDEAVISDGGVLKRVDFNYIMNEPCFLAYKTANSTFADSTFTTLINATVVQNSGTCYDTSNGRFTCPAGQDGTYYMYGSFRINNYDPNRCQGEFHVNGSSLGHSRQETVPQGDVSGRNPTVLSMMIMNLSATDYVEFKGYQSSGSSDTVFQSVFGGFKIR